MAGQQPKQLPTAVTKLPTDPVLKNIQHKINIVGGADHWRPNAPSTLPRPAPDTGETHFVRSAPFFAANKDRSKTPSGLYILDANFIPVQLPEILEKARLTLKPNGTLVNAQGGLATLVLWHKLVQVTTPRASIDPNQRWSLLTPVAAASPYPLSWSAPGVAGPPTTASAAPSPPIPAPILGDPFKTAIAPIRLFNTSKPAPGLAAHPPSTTSAAIATRLPPVPPLPMAASGRHTASAWMVMPTSKTALSVGVGPGNKPLNEREIKSLFLSARFPCSSGPQFKPAFHLSINTSCFSTAFPLRRIRLQPEVRLEIRFAAR